MRLRMIDFFTKYHMDHCMEFQPENVVFKLVDDWDKIREIQKFVLSSDNCYFISLDYDQMVIRVD